MKRTKGFISIFFKGQGMRKVFSSLIFAVSLVVFLSLSGTASGDTLYVGPGETLTEIQPAINAVISGDTIIVRDGTYTGANNKNLDFGGKSITLKSENGPQYCIIDCEGSGRGFYFHSGEISDSIVDGFTIKNGSWPYVRWYEGGGGIYCYYSSPTITNCIINGNTCNGAFGGGIANEHASPQITNCIISANAGGWGGGISNAFSSPQIFNCTISANYASAHGGGILSYSSSTATKNCIITGNVTAGNGGGINKQYCSGPIANCTFSGNSAVWGGGIYCSYCSPSITNSIFWEDYASYFGPEVLSWSGSHPTIQYSDIRGGQSGVHQTSDALVNWGEWKPWPGNGNINADPLFVGGGDYHLAEFSPCIDMGTDAGVYTDIDGDVRPYDIPGVGKNGTGDEFDMGADEFAPPLLNEPPIAVCKDIEIHVDENCQASIVAEDVDGGSSDPDEGDTITLSINNIGPLSLGENWVTLTVTDESGESDTCEAKVTVVDTIPPIPDVSPLPTLTGECKVTILAPKATDNCAGIITGTTSDSLEYTEQGTYTVTWTYDDRNRNTTTQTQTVVVDDVTAPEISVSVNPNILRPPNHKMVLITPTIYVSDNCDPNPTVVVTSITMNEEDETNAYDPIYDSTLGDGHTINDIQVINGDVYLRAERSGKGPGRIYIIEYTATDASGNSATTTAAVTVPHDQK